MANQISRSTRFEMLAPVAKSRRNGKWFAVPTALGLTVLSAVVPLGRDASEAQAAKSPLEQATHLRTNAIESGRRTFTAHYLLKEAGAGTLRYMYSQDPPKSVAFETLPLGAWQKQVTIGSKSVVCSMSPHDRTVRCFSGSALPPFGEPNAAVSDLGGIQTAIRQGRLVGTSFRNIGGAQSECFRTVGVAGAKPSFECFAVESGILSALAGVPHQNGQRQAVGIRLTSFSPRSNVANQSLPKTTSIG